MRSILILMQLQDFNRIKRRGGWKIVSVFPFLEKITDIWKQPLVFRGAFLPGNLRCLDSTKSGHTGKIRCSVIAWDIDVFWIVIWRTNSKYLGKLGILVITYIFSWDNKVFHTLWYLLNSWGNDAFRFLSLANSYQYLPGTLRCFVK